MSSAAVNLREWETLRPDRGSPLAGRTLDGDETARRLSEWLAKRGRIEVLELARGLEVRATSFVGRFKLGSLSITVQPKLAGAPFLNLLRYAYALRHLRLYDPVDLSVAQWAFQDLLTKQLAAEAEELLARGIHRDYRRARADLANPKGRIEFDRFVAVVHAGRALLPCVYYPRSEDTVLNRVVVAGLEHAAQLTADIDLRAHLRRLIGMFGTTVAVRRLDATFLSNAQHAMDRRTAAYRAALVVIGLLLQDKGVSLGEESNGLTLDGFLFDMNRFFQALISRFLHDHLEGYEIHDEPRLNELFRYDPERNPQHRRAPAQKPDFVVKRNGKVAVILDAKYRDLWENPLPREMLYQLALYALGRSGGDRTAVILYPTMSGQAVEQAISIRGPIAGTILGRVVLRPVVLLELEALLRDKSWQANRQRAVLARKLLFGQKAKD